MLFGQGAEGFGEQRHFVAGEGKLVGLGAEQLAVHAHDVADVELFEILVGFFAHEFARGIALDASAAIHKMEKGHLAEGAVGNDAPGAGERFRQLFKLGCGIGFVFGADGSGVVGFDEPVAMKGDSGIHEFAGFHHAVFDDFVEFVLVGEALKHGHEVGCVSRFGGKLDGLVVCRFLVAQGNLSILNNDWRPATFSA